MATNRPSTRLGRNRATCGGVPFVPNEAKEIGADDPPVVPFRG